MACIISNALENYLKKQFRDMKKIKKLTNFQFEHKVFLLQDAKGE